MFLLLLVVSLVVCIQLWSNLSFAPVRPLPRPALRTPPCFNSTHSRSLIDALQFVQNNRSPIVNALRSNASSPSSLLTLLSSLPPVTIVAAGPRRTASTWLFDTLKTIVMCQTIVSYTAEISRVFFFDFFRPEYEHAFVRVVKVHEPMPQLANQSVAVFTSQRHVVHQAASLACMGDRRPVRPAHQLLRTIDREIDHLHFWKEHACACCHVRYEDMVADTRYHTQNLIDALSMTPYVNTTHVMKIVAQLTAQRPHNRPCGNVSSFLSSTHGNAFLRGLSEKAQMWMKHEQYVIDRE